MNRQPVKNEPAEGVAPSYSVPALEKALDVLEFLSNAQQALGLNEIAEALDRSRPELFRVMVCLHSRGYVLRDASGRYRLGSKMFEVGSRQIARQALVSLAMPALEDLAATSGESCQLSIVERNRLLVIATAVGSGYLQLELKVGTAIPLYYSVVGLVAIAFGPETGYEESWQRRQEIVKQGGDIIEPDLPDYRAWRKRLDAIRRNGGLAAQSAQHPGSRVHAAPLVDSVGNLVAILSLTRLVPAREPPQRTEVIAGAVGACARAISSNYGTNEGTDEAAFRA